MNCVDPPGVVVVEAVPGLEAAAAAAAADNIDAAGYLHLGQGDEEGTAWLGIQK